MSAFVHHGAAEPLNQPMLNPEWPLCEQAVLPGDGSMRWLGLLMLGSTSLITLGGLYWLGQTLYAHL